MIVPGLTDLLVFAPGLSNWAVAEDFFPLYPLPLPVCMLEAFPESLVFHESTGGTRPSYINTN